jgi:hypothetical protein
MKPPPPSREILSWLCLALVVLLPARPGGCADPAPPGGRPQWSHGIPASENDFPIAVWLQDPRNARRYRDAGINLYVGLWKGPTSQQLTQLEKAGMRVICAQTQFGLEQRDNPTIVGWMHDDEPDNAQSLPNGKGYGPPVLPEQILRDYERLRAADPTRPVLLNLGQGVAWDNWIGRGVRRNHPEDYPEYVKGCDIASFDIYPAVHESPEVAGKLEFVPRGVERLVQWTRGERMVWACIEASRIGNPEVKPTPDQVRAEVWMALIQGARGLIYFVHQFKPVFKEASLLEDPELLPAITSLNHQILQLAPLLNSPAIPTGARLTTAPADGRVAWMMKRGAGRTVLFAVNLQARPATASFAVSDVGVHSDAEVLGESRKVVLNRGVLADEFKPYAVHLYQWDTGR